MLVCLGEKVGNGLSIAGRTREATLPRTARVPRQWSLRSAPLWVLATAVFLLGSAVQGEEPIRVAVDDLKAAGDDTSSAEAQAYSQFIREQLVGRGRYETLERGTMLTILDAAHFRLPCYELTSFAKMGRLLSVQHVITGNLVRTGERVELTLRSIDVKKRQITSGILRTREPCTTDDLLGDWGLTVLAELLGVPKTDLGIPEPEPEIQVTPTPTPDPIQVLLDQFPGMIYVKPGRFKVGSDENEIVERPERTVYTTAYLIARYEVTQKEYAAFLAETGYKPPPHWVDGKYKPGTGNRPVSHVSFEDAQAYAEWAGMRLPTEVEWEVAARGPEALIYPWGNEFDPKRANVWGSPAGSAVDVGSYPLGKSPCGAEDMAGNVAEWVDADFRAYPGGMKRFKEFHHGLKVIRGGSWIFSSDYARSSYRYRRNPWEKKKGIGFRVARDAVPKAAPTPTPETPSAPPSVDSANAPGEG